MTLTLLHSQPEEQRRQKGLQRLRGLTLCRLLRCLRTVHNLEQLKSLHKNVHEPEKQF